MKYLLLGGAGFIGSHLADALVADGHDVTVIDSCVTSFPPTSDKILFLKADLTTHKGVESHIKQADVIYFLAGSVGVDYVINNPHKTLTNNTLLATRLIPMFEKHNKKVIFTSTSEIYGNGPFVETGNLTVGAPTNLRWAYAAAKLMTEFMIAASSFPYIITRLFNVVGPGQRGDYGMVLPRFVSAAKANNPLVIHGTGAQIRSFCHIDDALSMIRAVEPLNREIFNIGINAPTTILNLAERVISLSNSTSSIIHRPLEEVYVINYGDIDSRVPDVTKIQKIWKNTPKFDLDTTILGLL